MKRLGIFVVVLSSAAPLVGANKSAAIDVSGFRDATSHWRKINEPERVMQPLPNQPSYAPTQIREIAANVLLFQRDNGGWPKDYDMLAVLTDEQKKAVRDSRARSDTTFDNHTTHTQVEYLAHAYHVLGDGTYRDACVRGFDFMLAAQYAHGGFPQKFPNPKGFSAHITFNDGVMVGVLSVLKAAADRAEHFAWLDDARRARARDAVERGIACLLRCQVRIDGVLAGWGQQHDAQTFAPASARTFELASLAPQDTTDAVRFLMRLDAPSADIVRAIEGAVAWLRRVQLSGIRVEKISAPPVEFFRHKTDTDTVVVQDSSAPPLWARMIEIGTNRPIFASRDGVKVYSLAEVDRERRTGSGWYGDWPRKLIESEYPKWKARAEKQ
jgi:PelA/Pel-15E family pectate lyase